MVVNKKFIENQKLPFEYNQLEEFFYNDFNFPELQKVLINNLKEF